MDKMPQGLSDALQKLNKVDAKEVWDWLDSNRYAPSEMVELLVTAHKLKG